MTNGSPTKPDWVHAVVPLGGLASRLIGHGPRPGMLIRAWPDRQTAATAHSEYIIAQTLPGRRDGLKQDLGKVNQCAVRTRAGCRRRT